jgi:hypothetical protein
LSHSLADFPLRRFCADPARHDERLSSLQFAEEKRVNLDVDYLIHYLALGGETN